MRKYRYLAMAIGLFSITTGIIKAYAQQGPSTSDIDLKSNIIYAINGKKMLDNKSVIIYEDTIYIAVKDIEEVLDMNIEFEKDTLQIRQEILSGNQENKISCVDLEKAIIVDIDTLENKLTLLPCSDTEEITPYIILNIKDNTQIIYESIDKCIPMTMLEKEMIVSVKYTSINDKSGLKEYLANQIIIKESNIEESQDLTILESVEVLEINNKKGYIKVAYTGKDKRDIGREIIIHIDSNLNIKNEDNASCRIDNLKVGHRISVLTNGIMTKSKPPQTLGLEIKILNSKK